MPLDQNLEQTFIGHLSINVDAAAAPFTRSPPHLHDKNIEETSKRTNIELHVGTLNPNYGRNVALALNDLGDLDR